MQERKQAVLITGAGRGIGKRLAIGFAAAGNAVGLLARTRPELDVTQLEIEHAGGTAVRLHADVRDYRQLRAAANRFRARFGHIDVLVCAAGVLGPVGPLAEASPKAWRAAVETNLLGVVNSCRAVLPHMVERRRGKVIVLSGGGATHPRPNLSAYAASEAGVVRLVETVAAEVRDSNIQVNCVDPGPTYTNLTDGILKAREKAGWEETEDARKLQMTGGVPPREQIELALWLGSEKSNHVSGKLIHIHDDWKHLETSNIHPELFTLRRVHKV